MQQFPTLYNIDENGNVRTWYIEVDGDKYRTVSGIEGGKMVESGWTTAKPKNVGRANSTTAEEQAVLEVEAKYVKKKERKYSETKDAAARTNILEPMLAISWKDVKKKEKVIEQCWSQPKLDGIRCLVSKESMMSRTGKPIVSCWHIRKALDGFFEKYPHLVLDGELYNHKFRDDFNTISSLITQKKPTMEDLERSAMNVEYHVYDVIGPGLTYADRLDFLHYITYRDMVVQVPTVRVHDMTHLDDIYSDYLADGYEGQIIRLDSEYQHKRSKNLIKRKEFFDEEFEVLEIVEGNGNWAGYAKSVRCFDPRKKIEFSSGIKGTQEYTRDLLDLARNGNQPKLVTVRYPNLTPDGVPRFPVAVRFFQDTREF